MPNQPTNASLTAIVTELESLRNSSAITPQKYLDIFALLPERSDVRQWPAFLTNFPRTDLSKLPNEHTSGDAEPDQVPNDLSHTKNENLATGIAKAAQNPNHPAYPRHPKVLHSHTDVTLDTFN